MKKSLFSFALALSLFIPAFAQAAGDPFSSPPKNYQGMGGNMQINSIPEMPSEFPAVTPEKTPETHAAAMPTPVQNVSTGPSTWLALAIGLLLVGIGGLFGFRMSRKS